MHESYFEDNNYQYIHPSKLSKADLVCKHI